MKPHFIGHRESIAWLEGVDTLLLSFSLHNKNPLPIVIIDDNEEIFYHGCAKHHDEGRSKYTERVNNMSQVLQVVGTWMSQFGPVTFTGSPDHLKGHWDQKEGQGQITAGMFNPATGVLVFSYFQTWNNQHGAAAFLISASGREFHGNYAQPNGNNGSWDLTRI